jgi:penicillin-binding protein 1C
MSSTIFEATHRRVGASLFWYLDGQFVAQTQYRHTISLQPSVGKHELLIQDENGETKTIEFNVVYSPN